MNEKCPTRGEAMRRASRTTGRSALAAAVVMVIALGAFLGTAKPALAAPVQRAGVQGASAGSATIHLSVAAINEERCVIANESNSPVCESSDPVLVVDSTNTGDTKACTFTWKMYWDDGSTETVTRDGADGPRFIFKAVHLYREPRETTRYIVRWRAESVTGGCEIGSGENDFILDVPLR